MSFSEVLAGLLDGSSSKDVAQKDNPETPVAATESPAVADKPSVDPVEAAKVETPAADVTPPAVEAKQETGEQPAATEDPEIDLGDGTKVRLSELKQERARREKAEASYKSLHSESTKRFQEAGRLRDEANKSVENTRTLVKDIHSDEDLSEFIKAHPEAVSYLLDQPEATRGLLGNKKAIDEFWKDYELIIDNPRLAEKLSREDKPSPEAEAELTATRAVQFMEGVAESLHNAVETVAARYPGLNKDEVADYVLGLGGYTPELDAVGRLRMFQRLHTLFFADTPEGVRIDTKLLTDRFDSIKASAEVKASREASAAEKHNREVDAALRSDAPAASPKGGASPTATAEKPRKYPGGSAEVINHLMFGD